MNNEIKLHHNLITVPDGKKPTDYVTERHDIVLLFDCSKSNPNGDPDTGNMPRIQPDSLKGLATDVCQKRKLRNFFGLYNPDGTPRPDGVTEFGYQIFIRENAVLQESMETPEIKVLAQKIFIEELGRTQEEWDAKGKKRGSKGRKAEADLPEEAEKEEINPTEDSKKQAYRTALLRTFFDLRTFGGVISTEGPLRGSFYGQVRGPVQITFAESLDKVLQIDATITRCAVASVKEKEKQQREEDGDSGGNRTMGRKYGIDYGLYRSHIHFSSAFAAKTGFNYYDLDNFLFALQHMFDDDHAAGRHLRLVGLVDFQHQSALGNAPAHKLFDLVKVDGVTKEEDGKKIFASSDSEFPRSLSDYSGTAPGAEDKHIPVPGYEAKGITARKVVWEIPAL